MVANSWGVTVQKKWSSHNFFSFFNIARSVHYSVQLDKQKISLFWVDLKFFWYSLCGWQWRLGRGNGTFGQHQIRQEIPPAMMCGCGGRGWCDPDAWTAFASAADVFYVHMPRWWPLWHY
jgi:hypothetical protein